MPVTMGNPWDESEMDWRLHWLEAEGDLTPWRDRATSEARDAWRAVSRVLPTPPLDILVQRLPGAVIPEIGIGGHAYRKGLLALTLDPNNPHFAASLAEGGLRRTLVHEVHHCLRMGALGYGRTLGEALVSEGLAGQFTGWLLGSPPEPWERAVTDEVLRAHQPDAAALSDPTYDHNAWFFGTGGTRPRWFGYTLGYQLAGTWLTSAGVPGGDAWVTVPAATVLAASGIPGAAKPVIRYRGPRKQQDE